MQQVMFDAAAATRLIRPQAEAIDRGLPEWARRTNPIVRRELGVYWKTSTLDVSFVVRVYALQALYVLLSLFMPFLFTMMMPTVTVSLVLLPIGLVMHAQTVFSSSMSAAASVAGERRNNSFDLLRACPRPLHHILYSKVATVLWRNAENLITVIIGTALLSLPLLVIQYDIMISAVEQPVLMRVSLLAGLAASILRVPLEAAMAGAVGVMAGAAARTHYAATATGALLVGAYFMFINGIRMIALPLPLRLTVEIALPVLLPLLITFGAFRLAIFFLERDA